MFIPVHMFKRNFELFIYRDFKKSIQEDLKFHIMEIGSEKIGVK
jgi:hypothetical protein